MAASPSTELQGARILVADDEPGDLEVLRHLLEDQGCEVLLAPNGEVALSSAARGRVDLVLLDVRMPDLTGLDVCRQLKERPDTAAIPVVFITAHEDVDSLVRAFEAGGVDFVCKPFNPQELLARLAARLRMADSARLLARDNQRLHRRNRHLEGEVTLRRLLGHSVAPAARAQATAWEYNGLVAESPAMQLLLSELDPLRHTDAHVLICGEPGAGKELVGRTLHLGSGRAGGPFAVLRCRALPTDVVACLESRTRALALLCGIGAGAADLEDKDAGGISQAEGGTLYLDEVSRVPLPLQATLARALRSGTIRPPARAEPLPVDIRLVAATRCPADELDRGALLPELRACLHPDPLQVPPLRQRLEDIPLLAKHFAGRIAARLGVAAAQLTPEDLAELRSGFYAANVRELRQAVERKLLEVHHGVPTC